MYYGAHPVTDDLAGWFTFYNGRQTIEAGIKEGRNVFQMHPLKVRAAIALAIQEAFAASFVRWAAVWLSDSNAAAAAPFDQPQPSAKQMVRVTANTSACVILQPGGCLLRLTELSGFAGTKLVI